MADRKELIALTDNARDIIEALGRVIDATQEHDKAFEAHVEAGGYSWGWHGAALIHERDKARSDFAKALADFVDARIAEQVKHD